MSEHFYVCVTSHPLHPTRLAGEAVQWDDWGRQDLRQRQQAVC